jgi:hypothetical protein
MPNSTQRARTSRLANCSGKRRRTAVWFVRPYLLVLAMTLGVSGVAQEMHSKPIASPQAAQEPQRVAVASDAISVSNATDAEVAALRAETSSQLQAINAAASASAATDVPGASAPRPTTQRPVAASAVLAAEKPLRDQLQERLRLLEEYDKAVKLFKKANSPEQSPEQQATEVKSELVKLQALLALAATNPQVLLPQTLRGSGAATKSSVSAEMKEAIDAATSELKECKTKLDSMRSEVANWEVQQNARRADRDKLYQVVAAMKAHGAERPDSAAVVTTSSLSQRLAHERQVNSVWQSRVAAMRLKAIEAQIALEDKLAGVREGSVQLWQAHVQVAEKTLELLQTRYSAAAEQQERQLREKAADEENKARRSEDPLEQFRARRLAELLDLEAHVVKHEQALATSPPPSLDEQRSLADRAAADLARVKDLLNDGRISRLDAIRLNNDFRRIGPERDRLLRNELAVAEARLQYYEDALTRVEIELLQDSLHDRYELELLKERLPPQRWTEAGRILVDLERAQRALLVRRRSVLEQLTDGTAQTLDQVSRRLAILDEEYGFIRTHIFWVRDQEPIGLATIAQGWRECQHLVRALIRLAQDSARPQTWGRASVEFLTATLAVLGLPIVLIRLRRMIKLQISRDLPVEGSSEVGLSRVPL